MSAERESAGTYLRFVGWLRDDGEFTFDHGWETPRVTQPVRGMDGGRLTLLDREGRPLLSVPAEIQHDTCQSIGGHMKSRRVIGYVPWIAHAASLQLLVGGRVVHQREIATHRPEVRWERAVVEDDGLQISWAGTHSLPLWYAVGLANDLGQRVKIIDRITDSDAVLDVATLPLEGRCHVVVLASDGLRSATARSDSFVLPAKPARACILSPHATGDYSEAHGLSLVGNATSPRGERLSDELLRWYVDGTQVARGVCLHYLPPLPSGTHVIELHCGEHAAGIDRVRIDVRPRSQAEGAWQESLEKFQHETHAALN